MHILCRQRRQVVVVVDVVVVDVVVVVVDVVVVDAVVIIIVVVVVVVVGGGGGGGGGGVVVVVVLLLLFSDFCNIFCFVFSLFYIVLFCASSYSESKFLSPTPPPHRLMVRSLIGRKKKDSCLLEVAITLRTTTK